MYPLYKVPGLCYFETLLTRKRTIQERALSIHKLEPLRGTYRGPVGLGIPLLFKYFAPVPPGSVEANVDLFYNQRQFVHLLRCK